MNNYSHRDVVYYNILGGFEYQGEGMMTVITWSVDLSSWYWLCFEPPSFSRTKPGGYLEGQGDLVSGEEYGYYMSYMGYEATY